MTDRTKRVIIEWGMQAKGTMEFVVPYNTSKEELTDMAGNTLGEGVSFIPKLMASGIQFQGTANVIRGEENSPSPLSKLTVIGDPNGPPG